MITSFKKNTLLLLFCVLCATAALAQPSPLEASSGAPLETPAVHRQATTAQWEKAKEGIDFSGLQKAKPKKPSKTSTLPRMPSLSFLSGLSMFAKIALFGGIIALIVALLYYLVRQGLFLRNTAIPQGNTFSLADIEDNLHESNLHSFLAQAEANGDYRLAVRLYYLNILKNMSLREYIIWKKDKTNTQYLAETTQNAAALAPDFRRVSDLFERVWYTDIQLTAQDYATLKPLFAQVLAQL